MDPESPYFDTRASLERNPWSARDVAFVEAFPAVLSLKRLRAEPELARMPLLQKGSRLSVMPIDEDDWPRVLALR